MSEILDAHGLTEAEAIARSRSKNYPKPSVTADIAVLSRKGEEYKLLLVRRGGHPFIGKLALPGGFAEANEPIEETAARELREETGIEGLSLELVGVFSEPGRDPRGWTVSAAYVSVVDSELTAEAGDDAAEALWYTVKCSDGMVSLTRDDEVICWRSDEHEKEYLAFDHSKIIVATLRKIGLC